MAARLFGFLRVGNVLKRVDRAVQPAALIVQTIDVDASDDARAVRSLDDDLLVMKRLTGFDCESHRAVA